MVVLFMCGFFVYGPQSSLWALCPDLVGHKRAGTATGAMNFCAYLFAGLGELLDRALHGHPQRDVAGVFSWLHHLQRGRALWSRPSSGDRPGNVGSLS